MDVEILSIMKKIIWVISTILYYFVGNKLPHTFWPGGLFFSFLRVSLFRGMGCQVGLKCEIEPSIDIGLRPQISIGDYVQINRGVTVRSAIIGNYVMIAPGVVMLDRYHKFNRVDVPMATQGESARASIVIKNDVWIGQNVIIMPGLTVGQGVIIGAGSVITKDIPDFSVVAGVPGKIIRFRNE